jgi:hypothetical protein
LIFERHSSIIFFDIHSTLVILGFQFHLILQENH